MAEYYESQVKSLTERKLAVDKIAVTDQEQAVDYQKKLHGFEKIYFDKLLEAVKAQWSGTTQICQEGKNDTR